VAGRLTISLFCKRCGIYRSVHPSVIVCAACGGLLAPPRYRSVHPTVLPRSDKTVAKANRNATNKVKKPKGRTGVVPVYSEEYLRPDPGHPLGRGFPTGETMRENGETHRQAWMRVLRNDPCSYCNAPAASVDHIDPQSRRHRLTHTWVNFTGACERCNNAKGAQSLLLWLSRRPIGT
jgi:hypothetical protein